ncbi:MAG: YceI family protein [Patescibacteria group bacterium]
MKTLLYLIVVILVIWLGYNYINKDKRAVVLDDKKDDVIVPVTSTREVTTGVYEVANRESKAEWAGSKTLIKDYYDSGSIMIKSGTLIVAENKINSGEIIFDMNSITALTTGKGDGQDNLSKHLKSEDFFDAVKYPEAKFVVKGMYYAVGQAMLSGDLTIKAVTSPIAIPITLVIENNNLVLSGTASVDRTIWDVRYGSGKFFTGLGDKVINDIFTLKFKVVAGVAMAQ